MRKLTILFLLICFWLASYDAKATTFVQAATASCASSVTACTTTFAGNIAAGDAIIGGCDTYNGGGTSLGQNFSSVTDSAGSTYTLGTRVDDFANAGVNRVSLQPAYTLSAGAGSGKTVTGNYSPAWNPASGFVMCAWEEISSPPTRLDVTANGNDQAYGTAQPKTAAVTTNHAVEWLVGLETQVDGSASCTAGSDGQSGTFNFRARNNWFMIMDIAETSAASYSANTTSCGPPTRWVEYLLTFYTPSVAGQVGGFIVGP